MALTPKQEYFCRLVASGKSYIEAYKTAYDWKGKDNGAYTEAIKLANKEDIQAKIKALQKPLEIEIQKDNINARQKQIQEIEKRIEICKQKEDESSLIRYYDMLNKIYALYKESETEQKPESTVNALDIDTLKKLTGTA